MDGKIMDESNQSLFNILKIIGPLLFFVIVFVVLYKLTELGMGKSFAIAAVVAVLDYFVLSWTMKKVAK